jgi:hypothetical protein
MPLYYLLDCDTCDNSTKQFIGVKGLLFPSTIGFPSGDWHIDVSLEKNKVTCLCPGCFAEEESKEQMKQIKEKENL